ncbi:hypothetical protein [Paenibacillus sp. YN15]|uniref:hypothetical protein n=1 Tax=Paenibacillus sp. YN15 TaxID=1742774 RepID=UPI000DCD68CB|nr:hypothetical protein [Paenibacillus sp. YN15]RAU98642.1 hypothetical protein DQG13_17265 [Paenibacillus sp. YN15]
MNELLRIWGFIGVGLIVVSLAKKIWIAVDMKRLSRIPPEELYEVRGAGTGAYSSGQPKPEEES